LCEQFRLSSKENESKLLSKTALMWLMACSIGGVAIWAMHFVGMAAVSFNDPNDEPLPLRYRYDYTLVSLVVVIILAYVGIYICSRDDAFIIDKVDTIDAFIEKSRKLSITEIKQMKTSGTWPTASTRPAPPRPAPSSSFHPSLTPPGPSPISPPFLSSHSPLQRFR